VRPSSGSSSPRTMVFVSQNSVAFITASIYGNYILYRVFIIAPSTAALSHRKHAFAGISRESCRALGHDRRDILYLFARLIQSFLRALHLLADVGTR
jgi:hypothetical protein